MAGCTSYDVVFGGGLQSYTRAALINEVIKHLLLERNQIPQQFDLLRQQISVQESREQVQKIAYILTVFFSSILEVNFR